MSFFNFAVHSNVISGSGSIKELAGIYQKLECRNPLIITDSFLGKTDLPGRIKELIPNVSLFDGVQPDPRDKDVENGLEAVREHQADMLIAIGGGSSMDIAKLASILYKNDKGLDDIADNWNRITQPGLPLITVPTTVGTGSEMTRGAIFGDSKSHTKKVVISNYLAADYTILDPELLNTLPSSVTASTGADALTQGIEGIISTGSNSFSDALHLHAVSLIKDSLRPAVSNSKNVEAMDKMQKAAAMVGAGMAYSGVGAVHAIANTLGGHYRIPHGVACAILLIPVLKYNAIAVPNKYRLIADALGIQEAGLRDWEVSDLVIAEVQRLLDDVGINQTLEDFGLEEREISKIAKEAYHHSDIVTNPRSPSVEDIEKLIRQVFKAEALPSESREKVGQTI